MIKKINHVLCVLFWCFSQYAIGQVGVGTTSPDGSSILDVTSTQKGVLIPRMSSVERDAIVNPAKGLMIYNLDEDCIQVNSGTPSGSTWSCVGGSSTSTGGVSNNCNTNGFEGDYLEGVALVGANKFTLAIFNNSFSTADMNFATTDLVLTGASSGDITVSGVSQASATILPGTSITIEYTLSGTPSSQGTLTGVWTKQGLTCTKTIDIVKGDATFTLPQQAIVVSTIDVGIDQQGVIDNTTNQLTVSIPYTDGAGTYDAYTSTSVVSNAGTGQGGDVNTFHLSYPGGIFSASGSLSVTIVVEGDASFDAKKLTTGVQEAIADLEFQVNGNSKGFINIKNIGGIPDRNFADPNHKFVYATSQDDDGNVWLSHNLGANYTNINHPDFDPTAFVLTSNNHNAYGSLFQWGRYSDGHELINWTGSTSGTPVNGDTPTIVAVDDPGHGLFIVAATDPYFGWQNPQNDNLWQGESGVNNPCPQGFRLPTETEINDLLSLEGISDRYSAATSNVALAAMGSRGAFDGNIYSDGTYGLYWTSTTNAPSTESKMLNINNTVATLTVNLRAVGAAVRCIKD